MGWLSSEVAAMAGPTIRAVASVALRVVAMVNLCVSFIVFLVLKVIQSQEYWPCCAVVSAVSIGYTRTLVYEC